MDNRLSPEYVLLGLLYLKPGYGYELTKRLEADFGYIWRVSQSQTYNILKRLEGQGYIRSSIIELEKHPARQQVHLTRLGEHRFISWLETPTRCSVHAIRTEFITRLYFIQLLYPEKTILIIHHQMAEIQAGLNRLNASVQSLPLDRRFNRMAVEMRIMLLTSMIGWLNVCLAEFASDHMEGNDPE